MVLTFETKITEMHKERKAAKFWNLSNSETVYLVRILSCFTTTVAGNSSAIKVRSQIDFSQTATPIAHTLREVYQLVSIY